MNSATGSIRGPVLWIGRSRPHAGRSSSPPSNQLAHQALAVALFFKEFQPRVMRESGHCRSIRWTRARLAVKVCPALVPRGLAAAGSEFVGGNPGEARYYP
jgi:hypothetical protein